jgi:hypothetical protein
MTKGISVRHSGFVIDSDFWFRHSGFRQAVRAMSETPPLPVLVFRPSPRRWLAVFAGCLTFVLLALFVPMPAHVTWLTLIFFGGGGFLCLVQLTPGSAELRLTPDGFTTRQFFRERRIPWRDVDRFVVLSITTGLSTTRMVGFNYLPASDLRKRRHAVSRNMTGFDDSLRDTYGQDVEDLAELMERWRREYGEAARRQGVA